MLIYDRTRKDFLKNLRGKERRAMELAISDAEAAYAASCKVSQARFEEIRPTLNAAYAIWLAKLKEANDIFFASIPREEIAKRMGYTTPNSAPDSPTSVMNFCENYFREDRNQYHTILSDLQKLQQFLLTKQAEQPPAPKVTKQDTEARKLLTEFDASKTLCSTNPAPPTPNPDGSLDAERI